PSCWPSRKWPYTSRLPSAYHDSQTPLAMNLPAVFPIALKAFHQPTTWNVDHQIFQDSRREACPNPPAWHPSACEWDLTWQLHLVRRICASGFSVFSSLTTRAPCSTWVMMTLLMMI